jgi:hypothetical protein
MALTTDPMQHVNITLTKVLLTLIALIYHAISIVYPTQHIIKLLTKVLTCIRCFGFPCDIHCPSMHCVDSRHLFGKFQPWRGIKVCLPT